eukprot:maker-scaffold_1-snap-gene-25.8-mRNA-1 protein AED:0.03 eAED:0.03 QI:122/1/1/1/0.42/0.37/8/59/326
MDRKSQKKVSTKLVKPRHTQYRMFNSPLDSEAPIIVCDCIAYLRASKGLARKRVFMEVGELKDIFYLQGMYDAKFFSPQDKDECEFSVLNECSKIKEVKLDDFVVAGLLLSYLRQLPEPLVPLSVTKKLIDARKSIKDKEKLVKLFNEALREVPKPNLQLFGLILSFVREIKHYQKLNEMKAIDLSIAFGMCVFTTISKGAEMFEYMNENIPLVFHALIYSRVDLNMPRVKIVNKNTKYKDVRTEEEKSGLFDDNKELEELEGQMQDKARQMFNYVVPRTKRETIHDGLPSPVKAETAPVKFFTNFSDIQRTSVRSKLEQSISDVI